MLKYVTKNHFGCVARRVKNFGKNQMQRLIVFTLVRHNALYCENTRKITRKGHSHIG